MKKILLLLVILVLLGLGSFFVAGNMIRDNYMNFLTEHAQGMLTLANTRYERGLFVSKATTRVVIADPKKAVGEEYGIVLEHVFRHGPLPLETGEELRPALAQVETFLASAETQPEDVREILKKGPALEQAKYTAWIDFMGNVDGLVNIPAISISDAESNSSFTTDASVMRFQYGSSKKSLVGTWDFPGCRGQGPEGTSVMSGLRYKFNLEEKLPWVYVGDAAMEMALFEIAAAKSVSLKGLRLSTEGSMENSLLSNQQKISLDTLRVGENTYGPIGFNTVARNVNAQAVSDFQKHVFDILLRGGAQEDAREELQRYIGKLFTGNPEFQFDFSLRADEGDLEGKLNYRLAGSASGAVMNPLMILQRIEAEGEVSAQEALIRHFAAQIMGSGAEENATLFDQMYDAQIEPLVKQNMIVRDSGRLKSKASLKQGRLNVNGKEIPLS